MAIDSQELQRSIFIGVSAKRKRAPEERPITGQVEVKFRAANRESLTSPDLVTIRFL